jgi:transcriptional regulator with XRE-family HTH domain
MCATFGERLLVARNKANLSQAAVAAACGVSQASYSRWESDEASMPAADKVFQIARLLGIRAQWLAEGVPPEVGNPDDALVTSLKSPALKELLRLNHAYLISVEKTLPPYLLDLLEPPTEETKETFESKLRSVLGDFKDRSRDEPT